MSAAERELAAAWTAVGAWDGEVASITEIARAENVVYRVDLTDGSRRVLRLHRPGYTSRPELDSEVAWVASLADAAIPVPRPIACADGGHYASVDIDGVAHDVGMITWVDGVPVREGDAPVAPYFEAIGELAARLRVHNDAWHPPAGFVRRRWDADAFMGEQPFWGRFWEAAGLRADERALLAEAREAIGAALHDLSTGPHRFGLIHADLHLGNVMADGDSVTIIDFDDAGFGWYAHELAVSLQTVVDEPDYVEARRRLLDGYRSVVELDAEEEATIDTFVLVRRLMLIGWLDGRRGLPEYEARFRDLVDRALPAAKAWLDGR